VRQGVLGAFARRPAHARIVRGVAAWIVVLAGTAVADKVDGPVPWGVSVTVGGTADSERAASGHAGVTGWLARSPDSTPALSVELGADLDRVPWLSAPRELTAAPYSAAFARFRAPCATTGEKIALFGYADYIRFPIEMTGGVVLSDDGRRRTFAGGSGTAIDMCWKQGDGEPTCIAWFGGRAGGVRDEVNEYSTVVLSLVPITALRLGPLRVDANVGVGSASRALIDAPPDAGFHVTALVWDVAVRGRAGGVDLALASRREPYASSDGAMSIEDRVQASARIAHWTATVYAARTRWWTSAEAMAGPADTVGAELDFAIRYAGFDLVARGAVGRSFYASLDATLPELPTLGARATLEIQRTFHMRRLVIPRRR
jgi:hypothetical protein